MSKDKKDKRVTICPTCQRMLKVLEKEPQTLPQLTQQLPSDLGPVGSKLQALLDASLVEPVRSDSIPRVYGLTSLGQQWAKKPAPVKPLERLRRLEERVTELEKKAADRQDRINEKALPPYEKTDPYED